MTRGYSAAQLALIQAPNRRQKWALELELASSTLRYCTGQGAVSISGDVYYPGDFAATGMSVGDPRALSIGVSLDGRVSAMQAAYYGGEFDAADLALHWLLWDFDASGWVLIDTWRAAVSETRSKWPIIALTCRGSTGYNPGAIGSRGAKTCSNKYKGRLCQYAGALATCNKTRADCVAHSNEAHFRGYDQAPAPGTVVTIGSGGFVVAAAVGEVMTWNPNPHHLVDTTIKETGGEQPLDKVGGGSPLDLPPGRPPMGG